jgi:hypothetical protein
MHPFLLALTCAVLGIAGAVLTGSFGLGAAIIGLTLAVPLVLRGDRLAALGGLFIGFGAMWLLLLAVQTTSGGQSSDPGRSLLVGAVPLAMGLIALGIRFARTLGSVRDIPAR